MSDGVVEVLEVVALTEDLPGEGLVRGQVGTVVEAFEGSTYLVEFSDVHGETYALAPVSRDQLMVLHYERAGAA